MPRLKYLKIYDDDGEEMLEGSKVLVKGTHTRILYVNENGEIALSDFHFEDVTEPTVYGKK